MRRCGEWRIILTDDALQSFARECERLQVSAESYETQHAGPDHFAFDELYPNLERLCKKVIKINEDRKGG